MFRLVFLKIFESKSFSFFHDNYREQKHKLLVFSLIYNLVSDRRLIRAIAFHTTTGLHLPARIPLFDGENRTYLSPESP